MRSTPISSVVPARLRTTAAAAALLIAAALALAACNDKNGTATPASGTPPTSVAATGSPGSATQATVRTVGKTRWFEGFDKTVDNATVVPDELGGANVQIDIP
ncbi:hypothetical protein [Nocardia brasiliensis]|uniref:hypothetical protein n=1 Tax=Nocardia brasiliensis TaxID=37326 RepID=UPI002454F36D|nr:hypothetical protein [Nocardia brasiliensis]